jgi:drug/metabolite transporter (DMT)-like permease
MLIPVILYRKAIYISKQNLILALISGAFFALDLACWHASLLRSEATVSTLLGNCTPIWVGLCGMIFFKRRNGFKYWSGTLIAIFGMCVLIGIANVINLQIDLGITLAVVSSLFYAFYLLTSERIRKQVGTITFMFYSLIGSVITAGIICLIYKAPFVGFSNHTWAYMFGLALIPHFFGWLTINYSLGYIKSNIASVSLLSQSLFTAIFAAFTLNERLNFNQMIGGLVVLAGIYMVNYKREEKQ